MELICPANVTASSNPGSATTRVSWIEPDLTGWDGPTNLTSSFNPGAVFVIGTHKISYQQGFAEFDLNLDCYFFITVAGKYDSFRHKIKEIHNDFSNVFKDLKKSQKTPKVYFRCIKAYYLFV